MTGICQVNSVLGFLLFFSWGRPCVSVRSSVGRGVAISVEWQSVVVARLARWVARLLGMVVVVPWPCRPARPARRIWWMNSSGILLRWCLVRPPRY